jgi:hypothetical protein
VNASLRLNGSLKSSQEHLVLGGRGTTLGYQTGEYFRGRGARGKANAGMNGRKHAPVQRALSRLEDVPPLPRGRRREASVK